MDFQREREKIRKIKVTDLCFGIFSSTLPIEYRLNSKYNKIFVQCLK